MMMAFDDQFVKVICLGDIERVKGNIIDQLDTDQLAHLCFCAVVQTCRLELLEHLVCPFEVHAVAPPTGAVPKRGGQEGLADADMTALGETMAGVRPGALYRQIRELTKQLETPGSDQGPRSRQPDSEQGLQPKFASGGFS
jgi:hypothetical protein